MINYHSYEFTQEDDFLNVCVDYNIQFESNDETFLVSLPTAWSEKISKKFELETYDCYKIYFIGVKNEKVNRITDYKKVWGLMSLTTGMKDGYYNTSTHKIYLGVEKAKSVNFSVNSHIMIFKPKNHELNFDKLLSIMKMFYDGNHISYDELLKTIYQYNMDSYVVAWYVNEKINLSICGKNKIIFTDQDFKI